MPVFTPTFLTSLVARLCGALGTPPDLAEVVANSLVGANLAGHDSHGVMLVPVYAGQARAGRLQPAVRPTVAPASAWLATVVVDGAHGWGPPAAFLAADQVVERARQFGIGAAVVCRSGHIGRVGQYVERMAAHGFIGLVTCNTGPAVVPFGGQHPMLGTNPIAIAAPRPGGQTPVFFDGSTSVVAGHKVKLLAQQGLPTPAGWIVDRQGEPSTRPEDFLTGGALLPLGGYKGYALAVMVDLLAGLLSGASAAYLPDFSASNGVLMIAIEPEAFAARGDYLAHVEQICAALQAAPAHDPARPVRLPGEPEQIARRERTANGIPLADVVWQSLRDLADSLNVAWS